jgi:hypothetical protein
MSRLAIAAALAREDLCGGERLVAFSLASFAGRDGRAWPGAPAAAERAGLSRSRYLYVRDRLVRSGLISIEETASGRGRASIVALQFAADGPWWEGEINAELFEAVLSRSRARGPARLLLAALAAFGDTEGVVRGVSSGELCAAAGVADRSYRRARRELLESGELALLSSAGGRGNTNVWQVQASIHTPVVTRAGSSRQRVTPAAGSRPLLTTVPVTAADADGARQAELADLGSGTPAGESRPVLTGVWGQKGGQDRTVWEQSCPASSGVSGLKVGHDRTLFDLPAGETPAQTPAQTPAANARAGGEPQNPGTGAPPSPPGGGSRAGSMIVEQAYMTERGRRRRRLVRVDLDEVRRGLGIPTAADREDWRRIRELLEAAVGESRFEIWLEPTELIAVDGRHRLVVGVPAATAAWTSTRFGRLLERCAARVGRELRFASEPEVDALGVTQRPVQHPSQEGAR